MLGTFEKATLVLDLYSTGHPEWGVTEVARTLKMPVSSVHVLMSSLTQMGLLHRTVAGRYRLGFKLLSLSQILLSNTPWRDVAQEEMTALFGQHGETLHLAAFDGGQIVNVARFPGRPPDSVQLPNVGAALPAYQGGSGRMLLAHRPWTVVRRVLLSGEIPNEQLDQAAQVLEQVVQDGVALYEDPATRTWSVAAPVHNHNSEVIAAISFTVPITRSTEARAALQRALLATSAHISARIGYVAGLQNRGQMVWLSVGGEEKLQGMPQPRSLRRLPLRDDDEAGQARISYPRRRPAARP